MRRELSIAGWAVLAAVLAPAGASAQRGFSLPPTNNSIPASVTSFSDRIGNFNNSIPPSVTSIRPSRGMVAGSTFFPTFHRRHVPVIVPIFVPIYSGYGYPYSYYPDYDPMVPSYAQPQPVAATAPVEEPQAPAQTVFENRPGYKAPSAYAQPAAPAAPAQTAAPPEAAAPQAQHTAPVAPEPPTILVFKDGHKFEIGNYAIVGETLYNMSGSTGVPGRHAFKIALADLDLDATIKANEERGLEFHLPKKNG
jgi:hypothetical protein